jgi:hypothetical protein
VKYSRMRGAIISVLSLDNIISPDINSGWDNMPLGNPQRKQIMRSKWARDCIYELNNNSDEVMSIMRRYQY